MKKIIIAGVAALLSMPAYAQTSSQYYAALHAALTLEKLQDKDAKPLYNVLCLTLPSPSMCIAKLENVTELFSDARIALDRAEASTRANEPLAGKRLDDFTSKLLIYKAARDEFTLYLMRPPQQRAEVPN